jgi:hypothetical protein
VESFFESLDDLGVLAGMARTRAHMGKAQSMEQRSDIALMIGDAETLTNNALKIDAPPAHDAVDLSVGTRLDNGGQFSLLVRRQPRVGPLAQASNRPSGPALLNRWTQSRSVWRSMPPIRAASARFIPSRTAASDNRRRL